MDGLILPGIVTYIRSKVDGSLSVTVETQELSPSKAGELFSLRGKVIALYMSSKEIISQKEMDQVDSIDADLSGKTKSQRLRAVLYRIWEQENEGHKTFESFYASKMEGHITNLKQHLQQLTT
jgi:hypothetical protein